jgi:5-deoxy-glucuronate isomerase
MDFAIVVQSPGDTLRETSSLETAWLLLAGEARLSWGDRHATVRRDSIFDQDPTALHVPPGTPVAIEALTAVEWIRVRTPNDDPFPATLFEPAGLLESERRDAGLWDDMAHRVVRTIFDTRNRPTAKLVLGEVVALPGRWSSYPPHHHPHPEIYHYRFTAPQGYGHGEAGDEVLKVRQGDTLLIPGGRDHSQVAAPGYGMWYAWVIRHLPGNPYVAPEFTEAHRWLKAPGAAIPRIGGTR